jgi:hypothetical protein
MSASLHTLPRRHPVGLGRLVVSRPTSRTLALPHALLGNESKVQFQLVVVVPQSLPKTQLFVTLR